MTQQEQHTQANEKKQSIYVTASLIALIIVAAVGGIAYLWSTWNIVSIDTATITAPSILLSPTTSGTLQALYVKPGDTVTANEPVALVGNEVVKTKIAGEVISTQDTIGMLVSPGQAVVTMIDPTALRVDGRLDEDKGLSRIHEGDKIVFTADAFGGTQYSGIVDEVSPTSHQSDIVFNISSAREEQQFDIKARFNTALYPELKNGMSARMWVIVQ
jgi:multidrug resistance efflux pump